MQTYEISFSKLNYIAVHAKAILEKHFKEYGLPADKKALKEVDNLLLYLRSTIEDKYTIIEGELPF